MSNSFTTKGTYLMHKKASAYEKLLDITGYPDTGAAPEMLDATTLSDGSRVSKPGIQGLTSMSFDAFCDPDKYDDLKSLEDTEQEFAIYFDGEISADGAPKGSKLKLGFKGIPHFYIPSGGVNAIVGLKCDIAVTVAPHKIS